MMPKHLNGTLIMHSARTLLIGLVIAVPLAQGCKKSGSSAQGFGPLGGGGNCGGSGSKFGTLGNCGTSGQATITFTQWYNELQNSDYEEAGQTLLKDHLDDLQADASDDAAVTLIDNSGRGLSR